ncbi:MAG: hypothetical protein ABSD28_13425 [Tepidisphaeraceae bacterium]
MPGNMPMGEKLMKLLTSSDHVRGTLVHMSNADLLHVLEVADEENEIEFIALELAPELARRLMVQEKQIEDLRQKKGNA